MRIEKILTGINPAKSKGIEIGPLGNPAVTKDMGDIRYVDFSTREELVKHYSKDPNVNTNNIPEIDYIWGEKTLREIVGSEEKFDYVIASHVIEHVPDLIGWLSEINEILADNGVLSLVIPDKRCTFDILRNESTPAEMVHAYTSKSRKPTVQQMFDCFTNQVNVDLKGIWSGNVNPENLPKNHTPKAIYEVCLKTTKANSYFDTHCWVFTPHSFFKLLKVASELNLFNYKIVHFYTTAKNKHEFYVTLQKIPSTVSAEEKLRIQIKSIPDVPNENIQDMDVEKNLISSKNFIKYLIYSIKNKFSNK